MEDLHYKLKYLREQLGEEEFNRTVGRYTSWAILSQVFVVVGAMIFMALSGGV